MTFKHIMHHLTGLNYQIMLDDDKPDNRFVVHLQHYVFRGKCPELTK